MKSNVYNYFNMEWYNIAFIVVLIIVGVVVYRRKSE